MICAALAVLTLLAAPAPAAKPRPAKPTPARPTAAAAASAKPVAGPRRFSHWIEDLPLMPGMAEAGGYSFEIFQGGRLAEARLNGAQSPQVVSSFYTATLPALGWRPSPSESYAWLRGRERLILHVSAVAPKAAVAAAKGAAAKPVPPSALAVFALSPEGPAKPAVVAAPKDVL